MAAPKSAAGKPAASSRTKAADKAPEQQPPGTELAEAKPPSPKEIMKGKLMAMQPEWGMALPEHVTADRFTRIAMTAVLGNPDLMNADKPSLMRALTQCAQDGLVPDGREAALVIYKVKDKHDASIWHALVQYQPMVQGLLQLVYNTETVSTFEVSVVKENDKFTYRRGDNPCIEHEPALRKPGNTIGAYAIVRMKDGGVRREWMNIDEILAIKARSRSKDKGPWVTDFDQMCCKTIARRTIKYLPKSSGRSAEALNRALEADNATYDYSRALPAPDGRNALAHDPAPPPVAGAEQKGQRKQASRMRGLVTGNPEPAPDDVAPQGSVIDGDFVDSGAPAYDHDDALGHIGAFPPDHDDDHPL